MSDQKELLQEKYVEDHPTSRRQNRRERITERRANRENGGLGWIGGLILIVIGVLYLLYYAGILPSFSNWWALFLLLPAVGTLSAALSAYRRNDGQWTGEVIGLFLAGLFFLGLTAFFLFGLDYGWLWPFFLIAAGLLLIAGPLLSRGRGSGSE